MEGTETPEKEWKKEKSFLIEVQNVFVLTTLIKHVKIKIDLAQLR